MSERCSLLMSQIRNIEAVQKKQDDFAKEIDGKKLTNEVNLEFKEKILKMMAFSKDDGFRRLIVDINKGFKESNPLPIQEVFGRIRSEVNFKEFPAEKTLMLREAMMNAGEKIVFDTIDKKLFEELSKDVINKVYTAEQVATENPLHRIFKGIVTLNRHYDQFASEKLSEAIGFKKGLQEAYISGDKLAKHIVDGLHIKGNDDAAIEKSRKHFDKIFDLFFEGVSDISTDLVSKGKYTTGMQVKVDGKVLRGRQALNYMKDQITEKDKRELYDKLYRVGSQKKYGDRMIHLKTEMKKDGDFNLYRSEISEEQIIDRVLLLDEIETKNISLRFLKASSAKNLKSLILPSKQGDINLRAFYKTHVRKIAKSVDEKIINRIDDKLDENNLTIADIYGAKLKDSTDPYLNEIDYMKELIHDVNNSTDLGKVIRRQLGMKPEEVFMSSFGDKDGIFQYYSYEPLVKKIKKNKSNISDIHREQLQLSEIEYGLKMGFRRSDSLTWEQFEVRLLKEIRKNPVGAVQRTKDFYIGKLSDSKDAVRVGAEENLFGIPVKNINKREASMMSNVETFRGHNREIDSYILSEYHDPDQGEFASVLSSLGDRPQYLTQEKIDNFFTELESIDPDIVNSSYRDSLVVMNGDKMDKKQTYANIHEYFKKTYFIDYDDGYSAVSDSVGKDRAKINGYKKAGAFKDHFLTEKDDIRIMHKTLFNVDEATMLDGSAIDGVITGVSSLKLGSDAYESILQDAYIDGEKRTLIYKTKVNTSGFKNAASDSFKEKETISLPFQILNKLPHEYKIKTEEYLRKRIDSIFMDAAKGLGDMKTDSIINSSINDDVIAAIYSKFKIGGVSDTVINSTLLSALDEAVAIINKPDVAGSSVTIKKSRRYIETKNGFIHKLGRKEVLVSKENPIVKQEVEKQKAEFISKLEGQYEKSYDEILADDLIPDNVKDFKMQDVYVSTYRNPIPNVENFGVMKLIFLEDLQALAKEKGDELGLRLDKKQAVIHPENTFMKLEADHDGDKMQLLSLDSEIGDIVAKGVLKDSNESMVASLGDERMVDYLRDGGEYKNDFLVVSDIKGEKGTEKGQNPFVSDLLQKRISSLEAKSTISIVMSTVRTLDIIQQLHQGWKEGTLTKQEQKDIKIVGQDLIDKGELPTLENIFGKFGLSKDTVINKKEYESISSQIAQDTIDFGSSSRTQFDKDWIYKLLKTFNPEGNFGKDIAEKISNLNGQDKIESVTIRKIMGETSLPSIKKKILRYLDETYKDFLTENYNNSSRKFIYDDYMEKLFGHKPADAPRDTVPPMVLGKMNGKDFRLQDVYNLIKDSDEVFKNQKTSYPQEFIYFKTNLRGSVHNDENDFLTNFAMIQRLLDVSVEKLSDASWKKENGIVLAEGMKPKLLKDSFKYIDELNQLVDDGVIKKGDILGDEEFLETFKKLDVGSKRFVMSKLMAEGHNRFAALLNESERVNFLMKTQEYNLGKYNESFKTIDSNLREAGEIDGKTFVTETIAVDMGDLEAIETAMTDLSQLTKEQQSIIKMTLDNDEELKNLILNASGDTMSEKIGNILKELQSECN